MSEQTKITMIRWSRREITEAPHDSKWCKADEVSALEHALKYCGDDKEVMQNVIDVHEARLSKMERVFTTIAEGAERCVTESISAEDCVMNAEWVRDNARAALAGESR